MRNSNEIILGSSKLIDNEAQQVTWRKTYYRDEVANGILFDKFRNLFLKLKLFEQI